MPLNTYVSLNRKVFDEDSDKSLIELVQEVSIADPEELLINKEEYTVIESMVTELLSPFEREVLKSIWRVQIIMTLQKSLISLSNR